MALLKSGTYVAGDLIVEDSIKVNTIKSLENRNFPYIDVATTAPDKFKDRLAVFSNESSGLKPTSLKVTQARDALFVKVESKDSTQLSRLQIDHVNKLLEAQSSELSLLNGADTVNAEWIFQ